MTSRSPPGVRLRDPSKQARAARVLEADYGVAAAAVAICAAALIARLLPHTIFDPTLASEHRLGYPLTYWNALGILGCVGAVLCVHLACSTRDSPIARVLGAAAMPLLALTLLYTLSRGGIWAAAAALRRLRGAGAAAGADQRRDSDDSDHLDRAGRGEPDQRRSRTPTPLATVAAGKHVALVLAGCMLGGGAAAGEPAAAGRVAGGAEASGARSPACVSRARRLWRWCSSSPPALAANAPDVVRTKYHEFTDRTNTSPGAGEARLLSARPEGRFEIWHVALDSYREQPFHGSGAGTFALRWERERPNPAPGRQRPFALPRGAGGAGHRGPGAAGDRARADPRRVRLPRAGAGPGAVRGAAGRGLAWAVHAGVDWDWQMPAVTLWLFALGGAALSRSLRRRRRRHRTDIRQFLVRGGGVAACALVAILPTRVALSQAQLNSAIGAMYAGDCRQARDDAHGSLSDVSERPTPYTVLAYCDMGEGRYGRAVAAMRAGSAPGPRQLEPVLRPCRGAGWGRPGSPTSGADSGKAQPAQPSRAIRAEAFSRQQPIRLAGGCAQRRPDTAGPRRPVIAPARKLRPTTA